jgi:hypothetical protein
MDQFLGGPDQIKVEQVFPSNQKLLQYNFGRDITGWTFTAEYQTLVVDTITFNRNTGAPNFSSSSVIGSFPKVTLTTNAPSVVNATTGLVKVTIPADMYTGSIIPDARANVPITVFSLTWSDASTPVQTNSHRWSLIQCYEPGVTVGSPLTSTGYTALVV